MNGVLLVIYAALDIVNYIYYSVRSIDYSSVFKTNTKPKNKKISKAIKSKKAIDADIEE